MPPITEQSKFPKVVTITFAAATALIVPLAVVFVYYYNPGFANYLYIGFSAFVAVCLLTSIIVYEFLHCNKKDITTGEAEVSTPTQESLAKELSVNELLGPTRNASVIEACATPSTAPSTSNQNERPTTTGLMFTVTRKQKPCTSLMSRALQILESTTILEPEGNFLVAAIANIQLMEEGKPSLTVQILDDKVDLKKWLGNPIFFRDGHLYVGDTEVYATKFSIQYTCGRVIPAKNALVIRLPLHEKAFMDGLTALNYRIIPLDCHEGEKMTFSVVSHSTRKHVLNFICGRDNMKEYGVKFFLTYSELHILLASGFITDKKRNTLESFLTSINGTTLCTDVLFNPECIARFITEMIASKSLPHSHARFWYAVLKYTWGHLLTKYREVTNWLYGNSFDITDLGVLCAITCAENIIAPDQARVHIDTLKQYYDPCFRRYALSLSLLSTRSGPYFRNLVLEECICSNVVQVLENAKRLCSPDASTESIKALIRGMGKKSGLSFCLSAALYIPAFKNMPAYKILCDLYQDSEINFPQRVQSMESEQYTNKPDTEAQRTPLKLEVLRRLGTLHKTIAKAKAFDNAVVKTVEKIECEAASVDLKGALLEPGKNSKLLIVQDLVERLSKYIAADIHSSNNDNLSPKFSGLPSSLPHTSAVSTSSPNFEHTVESGAACEHSPEMLYAFSESNLRKAGDAALRDIMYLLLSSRRRTITDPIIPSELKFLVEAEIGEETTMGLTSVQEVKSSVRQYTA